MACGRCGLRWDMADEDRPACSPRLTLDRRESPRPAAPKIDKFNARVFVRQQVGQLGDRLTLERMERIAIAAYALGKAAK